VGLHIVASVVGKKNLTQNQMKKYQTALKALLVAGIVGTMANVGAVVGYAQTAPAPNLTVAQQQALASADGASLATAAAGIIAATPVAQRAAVAQAIAKFVASTKAPAAATLVLTRLVADVPAAAASILQVALTAAPSLQAALVAAMPAQASTIAAVVAARAPITFGAPPAAQSSNPLSVSAQ
jgi:hypothetical protein